MHLFSLFLYILCTWLSGNHSEPVRSTLSSGFVGNVGDASSNTFRSKDSRKKKKKNSTFLATLAEGASLDPS
jgi:hypothetical protein